jgi:hypothetical protein
VVPVSLVDGDTPDVLLEPVVPVVLPDDDVSEPVVPAAPMELELGAPLVPLAVVSGVVPELAVPPVVEPALPVVVGGVVVVLLLDVAPVLPLSAALCLEQAPSDRAAATANTAAAVLVRDVFIRETPLGLFESEGAARLLPYGAL